MLVHYRCVPFSKTAKTITEYTVINADGAVLYDEEKYKSLISTLKKGDVMEFEAITLDIREWLSQRCFYLLGLSLSRVSPS